MKKLIFILAITLITLNTYAQKNVMDVIKSTKNHSTLVNALVSAQLVAKLSGLGSFTMLAPTNDAFLKLAPGTLNVLLDKYNHDKLIRILSYHILIGSWTNIQLAEAIKNDGGTTELKTLNGNTLTATMDGGQVKLTDVLGNSSWVALADTKASNGMIHNIDSLVMPY